MRSGLGILILTAGQTNGLPAGPEAFGKMKAFSVMILQEKKALPFHCPIRMGKGPRVKESARRNCGTPEPVLEDRDQPRLHT